MAATTQITEDQIEVLINQALQEYHSDIKEIDENIKQYEDAIKKQPELALESYGHLRNESLKIKEQARDRLLKLINMIANRVKTKEFFNKGQENGGAWFFGSPEKIVAHLEKEKELKSENHDE